MTRYLRRAELVVVIATTVLMALIDILAVIYK